MKEPPAVEAPTAETITLLSISPVDADHESLKHIVTHSKSSGFTTSHWSIQRSFTLGSAISVLREVRPAIVVTECDLSPGTWGQVLAAINELPHPPLLIVTSRLADELLWSEVLNRGGWDVLLKPFDEEEVLRVLNIAWLHWKHQTGFRNDRTTAMTAVASA